MADSKSKAAVSGGSVMASRGQLETELMKTTINDQLNRLLTQLEDLEELKAEFNAGEYEEMKKETHTQLLEFQQFMEKTVQGNMTLVDTFGAAQLAIQAAVSSAFKTPEVIRLFAQKQPDALRTRFAHLRSELKLKHLSQADFNQQATEILIALQKLNIQLSDSEKQFLDSMSNSRNLESAIDKLDQKAIGATASTQIASAKK